MVQNTADRRKQITASSRISESTRVGTVLDSIYLIQGGVYAIRPACLSFCRSVYLCAASRKKMCMELHDIFTKVRSWPSLNVISFW